jgi:histidinol dehydrogenase
MKGRGLLGTRRCLTVLDADSRAGRRRIAELEERGAAVLDGRIVRRAAKIVEAVRRGGDRALLDLARRLDGAEARSARDLVLARRQEGAAVAGVGAAGKVGTVGMVGDGVEARDVVGVASDRREGPEAVGGVGDWGEAVRAGGEAEAVELPAGFAAALERAIAAVERFHAPQVRQGYRLAADDGVDLEERVLPLARVGVYVPGGRASYPSTVVMTVVPARLAGVAEIVVATPAAAFHGSAALRYTLRRLGVDEVWGVGGAQAVAALAYGTESLRRVDKIVGPGNAWVTAAKRLVAGDVGIDGLAGPSEVVIVAGDEADPCGAKAALPADPALIAADLLAQAEHDPLAVALLITPSRRLARRVAAEVEAQLEAMERAGKAGSAARRKDAVRSVKAGQANEVYVANAANTAHVANVAKAASLANAAAVDAARAANVRSAASARAALARFGAALVVAGWEEALALVERLAPEHLQLVGAGAEALASRVRNAGAVFVGASTPEVFGDYVAGPSHVLPTCGSARFASALGVEDFVRRCHTVRFTPAAAARWAAAAACLAEAEGLPAHAAAARRRLA